MLLPRAERTKSLSSIVKAKWVTQENITLKTPSQNSFEEKNNIRQQTNQTQELNQNEAEFEQNAEALQAANELMKNAIKSSQEIKQKSQEQGYSEGYAAGYEAGHLQGIREGQQEGLLSATAVTEVGLQEIREVVDCLNLERQTALENQEEDLLAIAFEISKKIMRQQVQEDEAVFLKIFDEVIHGDEENLKIYLSENQKTLDFHINREIAEKIKKLANKTKVIMLKDDDKIMVETDDAVIDMSLPVQLEQLDKAIEQSF